jgi:hypothetical protein
MSNVIRELLPENSNAEVQNILKKEIQDVMWQVLIYVEIAFPHEKGDGTDNEKTFNTIRPKILRVGNNKIRNLEKLFESYATLKVQEYRPIVRPDINVDIVNFRSKFRVNKKGEEDGTNTDREENL